ncbi:hypothetical protein A4A49_08300 [Nicotiana attenuata]|uniref:Uncharacterized protein n=1 Tax=Nicotiana attenuata TaxID=49451 RepID=A0A1J6ISM4_NICAT|nr:hypothetical protein A4A49_08300 [Nicotiana attenuata]
MDEMILDRFSSGDATGWIYRAERYFHFLGFSEEYWLPLPYFYLEGAALVWFDWLYQNKQFYDWNHFKEKLKLHFRAPTFTSPVRMAYTQVCPVPSMSTVPISIAFASDLYAGHSKADQVFDKNSQGEQPHSQTDSSSDAKELLNECIYHSEDGEFKVLATSILAESLFNTNNDPKVDDAYSNAHFIAPLMVVYLVADKSARLPFPVTQMLGGNTESVEIDLLDTIQPKESANKEGAWLRNIADIVFDKSLELKTTKLQCQFANVALLETAKYVSTEILSALFDEPMENEGVTSLLIHTTVADEDDEIVEQVQLSGYPHGFQVPNIAAASSGCKHVSWRVDLIISLQLQHFPIKFNCCKGFITSHISLLLLASDKMVDSTPARSERLNFIDPSANFFIVTIRATASDLCAWDPGISFKSKSLTGYTVNGEPLLLMGSTCIFFFFAYATSMTQVWEPGQQWLHNHYWTCYFTRPTTDFSADALAISPYLGVVIDATGKVLRERTAQVLQGVIVGQTGVNLGAQVNFALIVVFDLGGGPSDAPILEDSDGVLEAILKAIANLSICIAPLSVDNFCFHQLKATIHDITKSEYGLSLYEFYFIIESHSTDNIRVTCAFFIESYSADITRGTSAPGELQRKMKGSSNIDTTACLGKFDTLDIHPEVEGIVESIVESFSTLSRKSNGQLINMDLRVGMLENKCWQGNCASRSKNCYCPQNTYVL